MKISIDLTANLPEYKHEIIMSLNAPHLHDEAIDGVVKAFSDQLRAYLIFRKHQSSLNVKTKEEDSANDV